MHVFEIWSYVCIACLDRARNENGGGGMAGGGLVAEVERVRNLAALQPIVVVPSK